MYVFIIKQVRIKKNITLYKLAKNTGISIGYLQELENNKKHNPTFEILQNIANVLNVSIKSLFCEAVEMKSLKKEMYKRIDKYEINAPEVLEISQIIDLLVNIDMNEKR